MERVKNYGQMVRSMLDLISKAKSMGEESFFGQMVVPMKESSSKMKFMDLASINGIFLLKIIKLGMMEGNMKDNGTRTKCMDMEFSLGRMEELMMVIIIWIKRKAMVFSIGQMEGSIEVIGRMESKMERELILIRKRLKR